MAILKLQNVNDSATFRVKQAEVVAGKFGPQVKFEAENGDLLFISEDTAKRQLSRIPLEVIDCAGETLTFYRSENKSGGAPYWNISVADAVDRSKPTEPKRTIAPDVDGGTVEARRIAMTKQYLALWDMVATHLGQRCAQLKMPLTSEAVQSATATVWIAFRDRGIQPDGVVAEPALPTTPPPSGRRLSSPVMVPDANPADDNLPF
jgi:hypothetical protein